MKLRPMADNVLLKQAEALPFLIDNGKWTIDNLSTSLRLQPTDFHPQKPKCHVIARSAATWQSASFAAIGGA